MSCPFNTTIMTLPQKYRPPHRILIPTSFPLNYTSYINIWATDGAVSMISNGGVALDQVYWNIYYAIP